MFLDNREDTGGGLISDIERSEEREEERSVMSSFPGTFPALPGVLCDRFDKVEGAEQFFLSHCHIDHMRGKVELSLGGYSSGFYPRIINK